MKKVIIIKAVIEQFSKLLSNRLNYNDIHTTEDTVRYTYFASLVLHSDIQPHEVILEYPHPSLPGKEVDTYVPSISGREGLIIEFKYDRNSGTTSPRPHKTGKLFNDLYRLKIFNTDQNAKKWLVYLTDNEMASYLSKEENGLQSFFNLEIGGYLVINEQYIATKSNTFSSAITCYDKEELTIKCICSEDLPKQHKLRIYELSL